MLWVALFGYVISVICVLVARQSRQLGNRVSLWVAAILTLVTAAVSTFFVVVAVTLLTGPPIPW